MHFDRTDEARQRALRFGQELDRLCDQLSSWPEEEASVKQLRDSYFRKCHEFFDQDHVFSLAVIGQVKAGKSTFLNTLLLGGKDLLPQAAGPKTAVLTRLEYAPETRVTVEYYSEEDWQLVKKNADIPLESATARGARDILRAAQGRESEKAMYAARGVEIFTCPDENSLIQLLEDTAGGQSTFAPFVKCVTLGLCREELRGVSVVDTPGLNDPVPSRSQRTKQFLEICDAAFFLSHSGYFLDETDLTLLTSQLPQKGIQLCLVGSRFDGALSDARADGESCAEEVRRQLTQRAKKKIDHVLTSLERNGSPDLILNGIRSCREPIFVSAMADRMASKSPGKYTAREKVIAQNLNNPNPNDLVSLGNMEQIRQRFEQFAMEKDVTLAHRADNFAAMAQTELQSLLAHLRERRDKQQKELDIEEKEILEHSAQLAADTQRVNAQAAQFFDLYLEPLESLLDDARRALAEMEQSAPLPAERTDVKLQSQSTTVSDSTFWKPWTWGRSHREYTVRENTSSYWEAQDTLDFLATFPREMALLWDRIYAPFADTHSLHNRLFMYAQRTLKEIECPAQGEEIQRIVRGALSHLYTPRMTLGTEKLCARLVSVLTALTMQEHVKRWKRPVHKRYNRQWNWRRMN